MVVVLVFEAPFSSVRMNPIQIPSTMASKIYLLTGDIGGTNARMSFYDANEGESGKPLLEKYYRNAEHIFEKELRPDTFQKRIIIPFLEHCAESLEIDSSCVIVAALATAESLRITKST